MSVFVGLLLITIAAVTVGSVLFLVMQEKHEHEEHYIPGQTPEMRGISDDSAQ
jgi:hypothetical protein